MNPEPRELPPPQNQTMGAWLREHAAALSGLVTGLCALTLAGLPLVTMPSYPDVPLSKTFQVWRYDLGPRSGNSGGAVEDHKLTLRFTPPAYAKDDIPVTVTISDVQGGSVGVNVLIVLETNGLAISPKDGKSVPLKNGAQASFFVRSDNPGNRLLQAHDQMWLVEQPNIFEKPGPTSQVGALLPDSRSKNDSNILTIPFIERPVFTFLSRQTANDLAAVSAVIGIPGLILFVFNLMKDRNGGRPNQTTARPVIRPPEGYHKPRKRDP